MYIKGPLQPQNIEVDGSLSSQFLTGLLLAYASSEARDVTIKVNNLNSRPYIDLTLQVMKDFGLKIPTNNNYRSFHFDSTALPGKNETINYMVEADWSGGAFLLVAGAIAGEIIVEGLDVDSTQADKAILNALEQAGAIMKIEKKQIKIKSGALKAFQFNATDCPDLFPPLVTLAAFCEGTSLIEGIHRLTHKESNRALTLQEEFGKMGLEINLKGDQMTVKGVNSLKGTFVHSHHDHRIAMACAIAALRADTQMIIEGAEAVNKSYPDFWDHLQKLSGAVSLNQN
jgi:3-phosphoshikimate 1-carboxyvinyltransferase